jgi:HEAT repeat protein
MVTGLVLGRLMFHPAALVQGPLGGVSEQIQPATYQEQLDQDQNHLLEDVLKGDSRITDLRVRPASTQEGLVQVSFKAEKEFAVQGKPGDRMILELLGWAVMHEENSGVRLQSVEELAQASSLDARARQVLAYALVNDRNDGVRLKALEALGTAQRDELVEDAILNALLKDPNPAVRIRAIDVLLSSGTANKALSALLAVAQADSNDYVRSQARRAIRETHDDYRMLDGRGQLPSGVRMQEVGKEN